MRAPACAAALAALMSAAAAWPAAAAVPARPPAPASAAAAPTTALDAAAWRGDVRFLRAAIDSLHPQPYRRHPRAAWDSAATALARRLPSLPPWDAVGAISAFVALLGDGHSRLDQVRLEAHTRPTLAPLGLPGMDTRYPVGFAIHADGLWIERARAPYEDLVGARVVAIGGRPVAAAVAALAPLISADNRMWTLYVLPEYLRAPGYACAAGLVPDPGAPLPLTLAAAGGAPRAARLAPGRDDPAGRWTAAPVRAGSAPWARLPDATFAFADLGDSTRTTYARIRAIVDEPGQESFAAFTARLFAHLDSTGCRRLILDLRGNGGGNNYLNQPLVHAVIRHPAVDRLGGLFVVTDRGTFSAAVSLAADLERETQALFVGEPTGGAPDSPGDPAHVTLPASRLVVRIATTFWAGSDPRDPREAIYPDLPAMPTWAEAHAGRDVALEAIAAWRPAPDAHEVPPNQHWAAPAQQRGALPAIRW